MGRLPALLILLALLAPGDAAASCLEIERVTAFAPRGQVYVDVAADCRPADFAGEGSIVAYLELLVGDRPAVGDDVRVDFDHPRGRQTFEFGDLPLTPGQPILTRLVRFGEILDLRALTLP